MSYEKKLALLITLVIFMPVAVITMAEINAQPRIQDLPQPERSAISQIRSLGINVRADNVFR